MVRLEGRDGDPDRVGGISVSPLPLFVDAKVLEIGAFFADCWYRYFWEDLEKIRPQLTTLRLDVIEGMDPTVAELVKWFVKARLREGMPLAVVERMTFEGMDEEDETKAKRLWEEYRASLDIDQYLVPQ